MNTKIYSITFNRPDFIQIQKMTFQRFLAEEHELVIVNNATDTTTREQISEECKRNSLECIEVSFQVPRDQPGLHHALAVNKVWQEHISNNTGYAAIVDGDLFMIKDFSIEKYLCDYVMAGAKQKREKYHYLTPIVMLFNLDKMSDKKTINWIGVHVNGVALDTGGGLYAYLDSHPEIKEKVRGMQFTHHITSQNNNLHVLPDKVLETYNSDYVWELFTHSFLHYCRSSNWDHQTYEFHKQKTSAMVDFICGCMSGSIVPKEYEFQIINPIFGWP
jgi:hypothetical protein